jgi:glycosyltransferase involved in cell wall biosynthesis
VVPAADARALADAMQRLVADPREIAGHSRELLGMADRFDWARHVGEMDRILSDAARDRRS